MNRNELTDKHTSLRADSAVPSLERSLLIGGFGFALVSLCVFATVAFCERWMYENLGLIGAYLGWTALFILLGGGVLGSLVVDRWRLPKFYLLFGLAFFAYAIGWVVAYFIVRGTAGELIGSLAGSLLMSFVLTIGLGGAAGVLEHKLVRSCTCRHCSSSQTLLAIFSVQLLTIPSAEGQACCCGEQSTASA